MTATSLIASTLQYYKKMKENGIKLAMYFSLTALEISINIYCELETSRVNLEIGRIMLVIRKVLVFALIMLILVVTFKASLDFCHALHYECSRDNCPDCKKVKVAEHILSTLKSAIAVQAVAFFFFYSIEMRIKSFKVSFFKKITPVTLKVKLLN